MTMKITVVWDTAIRLPDAAIRHAVTLDMCTAHLSTPPNH